MATETTHLDTDDSWGPYAATIAGVFVGLAVLLGGQIVGLDDVLVPVGGLLALAGVAGLTYLIHVDH